MHELTTGWKLFRIVCILQMIAVGLQLILSAGALFYSSHKFFHIVSFIAYLLIFVFLYQGLSLINYNYPDTPLSAKQKKNFNWLFLLNFLLIAFLFSDLVSEWRRLAPFLAMFEGSILNYILLGFTLLLAVLVFCFHLVFLVGMYRLRRVIYKNSIELWQNQFSEQKNH
jgi:hypothetical protein